MGSLKSFIAVRLALFFPILWFMLSMIFVLLRIIPGGNPIRTMYPQMPQSQVDKITQELGLNDPIPVQYVNYLKDVIRFDFGTSLYTERQVSVEIIQPLGHTVTLAILSMLIGIPLGIYLGGFSGNNRQNKKDQTARIFNIGIYATPIFLVGIILQIIFSYWINILPPNGVISGGATGEFKAVTKIWLIDTMLAGRFDLTWDVLIHMILPSLALGMLIATSIARQVRTHMIDQLEQDYVQYARSRGIKESKVVYSYTLKNAVLPVISLIGLQFALLLSGAILTETVFNIPGLGRYVYEAITQKDFPRTQGAIIIFTIFVNVVSLLADIIYALLDPRVEY